MNNSVLMNQGSQRINMESVEQSVISDCFDMDSSIYTALKETTKQSINLESLPRVTTMTVLLSLNSSIRYFENFARYFEDNNGDQWLNETFGGEWSFKLYGGFYNCGILRCKLPKVPVGVKTLSIKIFRNGKLHLTGFQSFSDCLLYGNRIVQLLSEHFVSDNVRYNLKDNFKIIEAKPHLINVCLKYKLNPECVLGLKELNELLEHKAQMNTDPCCPFMFESVFNSDHHPGVRIKLTFKKSDKKVTIMVFKSGSILLNALLDALHLTSAFEFIVTFIEQNKAVVIKQVLDNKQSKEKKRKFDYASCVNLF